MCNGLSLCGSVHGKDVDDSIWFSHQLGSKCTLIWYRFLPHFHTISRFHIWTIQKIHQKEIHQNTKETISAGEKKHTPTNQQKRVNVEPWKPEAYLLILSVALLGFGLGATEGMTLIPMPFSSLDQWKAYKLYWGVIFLAHVKWWSGIYGYWWLILFRMIYSYRYIDSYFICILCDVLHTIYLESQWSTRFIQLSVDRYWCRNQRVHLFL